MSSIPSFIGMRAGTYGNVRTTNVARVSEEIGATYNVAFRGGSVMGTSVGSSGLIGFVIVLTLFQTQINNLNSIINWCGINYVPLIMTISSYSLGCSIVALFNRVGGGIFTKAADVGADTVGKTELNLPEDDPRNPAVIADNTGDLVGDIAGLGAEGITIVDDIYYIQRGYENFDEKLRGLGAVIEKTDSEDQIEKFILKVS